MTKFKPEPKKTVVSARADDATIQKLDKVCNELQITRAKYLENVLAESLEVDK